MSDSDDDSRSAAVGRKRKRSLATVRKEPSRVNRRSSMESGEISSSSGNNSSCVQGVSLRDSSESVGPLDPFKSHTSELEARASNLEAHAKTLGPCVNELSSERDSHDSDDLSSSDPGPASDENTRNPNMQVETPVTRRGEHLLRGVTLAELPQDQQELQTRYFNIKEPVEYIRCFCCAGLGHNPSGCPERTCKHCGARDEHSASGCPTYRKCTRCRQRGHDSRDCDNRSHLRPGGPDDPCDTCGHTGHFEDECPHLGDIYFPEQNARQRLGLSDRIEETMMLKSCYSCGLTTYDADGHWGDDCSHASHSHLDQPTGTWNRKHASRYLHDGPKGWTSINKSDESRRGSESGLQRAAFFDDARD